MTTGLASIGGAVLEVIGLNPQKIGRRSEGRVPGKATFTGMDYQRTGLGDRHIRIEFLTHPLVMGGLDTLAILTAIHEGQDVVPWLRLGRNYAASLEGLVVVQTLDVEEGRIHPFTGVGRVVHGEAELLIVGDTASFGTLGMAIGTGVTVAGIVGGYL